MSLINQMLRDLDARHAPALDRTALPGAIHVRAQAPARNWPMLALTLAVLAAGAWALLGGKAESLAPVPAPITVQRPVSPPPQALLATPQAAAGAVGATMTPATPGVATTPKDAVAEAQRAAAARPVAAAVPTPDRRQGGAARPIAPARAEIGPSLQEKAPPPAAPMHAAQGGSQAASLASAPKDVQQDGQATIEKRPRTPPGNETAENEFRKAMAAFRRGATSDAMEGLQAALRADGRHHSARQAMLSLLVERQQWAEAQAQLEEGLTLDPAQTGWAMLLARLQFENGKLAEAAATLARHAAHGDQDAEFQAFHGLLLQKLKRPGEATAFYQKALALKPAESRWWYGLGLSLEAEQKPLDARRAFLKARESGNLPAELAAAVDQKLR